MFSIKRHMQNGNVQTQSSATCHKLFVDYPYPILTELENTCKPKQKLSKHSCTVSYLRRYRNYLNKMLSTFNGLTNHNSSTLMLDPSAQQPNIDRYQSQAFVNNVSEEHQSMRTRKSLVSSINAEINY
ncbi:unnamed protein product [Rotaria socialis]|uniref:Uncharacterized protein n=3 Tax=Rotaria socialis TaxID=392032 RepID=A0A817SQK8_9BILA|nr:unnamed protein product [Rotaria socialis]CAF3756526.1 unnamed protein product [Rotaria socialis]